MKVLACAVALAAGSLASGEQRARADEAPHPIACAKNGICSLHGRVQIVNGGATYTIKIVKTAADLRVQKVKNLADVPGQWQFVESGPDFTVQIVDTGGDFTVQYVDMVPGCF
jgi:hypothetical protein